MSGDLEFNKMAAAVLTAGLIAIAAGKVADYLYDPETDVNTPGYEIAEADSSASGAAAEEEVFDLAALMAAADAASGQKTAKKCVSCHSFDQGGKHGIGPNLYAIMGDAQAGRAGYAYSSALTGLGGTWTREDMYAFLNKPKAYAKGTKMTFIGLKKPQQVANVIAYLETLQ